jgi:hypothetical protein
MSGPAVMHCGLSLEDCAARNKKRRAPSGEPETECLIGVDLDLEQAQREARALLVRAEDAFFERLAVISAIQALLVGRGSIALGGVCALRVEPVYKRENGDNWLLRFEVKQRQDKSTVLGVALTRPTSSPFESKRDELISFICPYTLPEGGELTIVARRTLLTAAARLTNEVLKSTTLRVL